MKIRSIKAENFGPLRQLEMENIPNFVVVVGQNGVGKTTLFKLIKLFQSSLRKLYIFEKANGRGNYSEFVKRFYSSYTCRIEIQVELTDKEMEYLNITKSFLSGIIDFAEPNNINYDYELGRLFTEGKKFSVIDYIKANRIIRKQSPNAINLNSLIRLLDDDDDRRLASRVDSELDSRFEKVKDYLAAIYLDDLIKYKEKGSLGTELEELKSTINLYITPKEFLGVERAETGLVFPVNYLGEIHDLDDLSSGEKEILMIFINLKWIQSENYILLYDEPELHLNARLERLLIRHLKQFQGSNQIWIATHSYEMLDSADISEVFKIEHCNSNNQISLLSTKEEKIEIFKQLGANIGLQLISERVIFVEGESDKDFLEGLFEDYADRITFIQTTGINNLMKINQATVDLLSEASKASDFFAIRDRDFLSEIEEKEIKEKFNYRIFILPKYHIENFFLNGDIFKEVLKDLGITKFITPKDVEIELMKIANRKKDIFITDWVAYELSSNLRNIDFVVKGNELKKQIIERAKDKSKLISSILDQKELEKRISLKEKYISDNWDNKWKDMIPGRDIIEMFCSEHVGIKKNYFKNLILRKALVVKSQEINNLKKELIKGMGL